MFKGNTMLSKDNKTNKNTTLKCNKKKSVSLLVKPKKNVKPSKIFTEKKQKNLEEKSLKKA